MSLLASSSVSVINVNDGATGAQGPQGISVTKVVEEYRLSDSKTELTGSGTGYSWSETKPSIPAGKYLWIRERTDLSNNQSSYGSAHCDIVTSGLVQDVDRNSGVITSKVWESYTSNYVNEYDGTTGKAIRDRVSKTETDINGITSRVSDVESETDDLGTRMTSAESSITQNADNIALMVTVDGTSSSLTLTQSMLTAMTSQFVVKDPAGSATIISGGKIHANAITTAMLATDAIKSTNYQASTSVSSPYSATGTFLDLGTGTLYMPNFGVNGTTGAAYFNGTVNANAGKFGDDSSYWNIETVYDYNMQPHAALVGTGSPYLQTGNWQVSDNAVATRKYTSTSDSSGNVTYYKDSGTNTFYDVGMKIPSNFSAYSASDSSVTKYNKAFYYGRKYTGNNAPSLDSDWTYFFSIDSGGNVITAGDVYEGGVKLSDKYAAITDVGSAYLPKTGGTITGNLSVNGSFTTNLQLQTNLGSTSSAQLTGAANAVVKPGVTGTLGVGNGGTGKSSWTANQIVYASASNTLSQLGSGTSGQILKSNGSSAPSWVNQSALSVGSATKATQDGNGNVIVNTYMPIAGGQFTGAVYVPNEFSADSAQLGSLIVNGAARFTNDVFADTFTGNLVGTASNAVKVGNNLVIKLNGGSTEGTNLFTYNGSAAKTINITASSIGAQASGTYAGGISNGGAASKLAYQAGNEINFVSTADTLPTSTYFNYRNGYTGSKTGVSADYAYYFDNGNAEYNHTTLYAAQFSGNAATATKLANARTITLSGSVTGSTTFDGSGNVTIATTTNHTHNYAGSSSAGGSANTVAGETGSVDAARHVWFSDSSTETKRNYDDDFKYNPSTNVLTVGSISGSAATLTTARTLTIGGTGKTFNGSANVSWTKAEISAEATTSANGWMSSDDKTKLDGIQAGAQVNTITGVKGGSETDYRTGNVNITASNIGLGNVTNNKQVKGLASGTTSGHLVSWGSDGYTVADSGLTATSVATKITLAGSDYSASSNTITITQANLQSAVQSTGLLLMTSAERSKLASIQVAEGGTIDFSGVTASAPLTATVSTNKTVNITHNTSGVTAGTYRSVTVNTYGHVTAGTNPTTLSGYGITDAKIASGVITLGSNTITPLTASSTLDATKLSGTASISTTGNAGTATKFASAQSVTLTGDTTGTASSTGGWSLATTTNKLSYQPQLTTQDAIDGFIEASKFMVATFKTTDANNIGMASNDGMIMSLAWQSTAYGAQLALDDVVTGVLKIRGRGNSVWGDWRTVIHDGNYTNYTVTKTGSGASGTWGISISGNAVTASKLATSRSLWGNSFDGSSNISGHIKLPATNSVIQTLADTSNWGLGLCWDKTTSYTQSYRPGIGFFNLGGNNGNGAISIVPYAQDTAPWGGSVGLFLTQDDIKFNNVSLVKNSGTWGISVTGNAATSTKWASAQTVYVALGTASKTTSIQGGSSSAVTLGVDGVLGVANGGTGAASFTANSVIMSGSTTTGAFTTRAVTNNTSASAVTANTNLITANTLAYWTGSSNLTTCSKGTFGTAATYSATTSVTSGSSALVTSGGVSSALGNYVTLSTAQTISGAKTFSAVTSITNTTASTSKSTGALKVSGGVGVSGQMSANTVMIGDAVSLVYDSSISALCFQFD